ncbi:MAG: carboxypeptidase-like regulatory domain-containing protein [Flavobacteriaceae bacterium]|nr:carboxypeptidase-like regulatory domain-containing protein [Flavobacteriaceae bacterium]
MKTNYLVTITFFLFSLVAFAQNSQEVSGYIYDDKGLAAEGVSVFVGGISKGTITNAKGYYQLVLPKGNHTITINYLGYKTIQQKISVGNSAKQVINFRLEEDSFDLDDVVIIAKTKAQQLREEAYAVEVIDTKTFENISTNANDILAKLPGVNIRQSGGLGSDFSLSLNGLSGKQVRTFIDGIPMDYFGSSLTLNNFSANLISQIEVYKGVVPIHLSSDALGGAINVITSNHKQSFLDVSYALGSFGTDISSLNAQYRNSKTGFTIKLKSFYNQSDNNYKVPVKLLNIETGKDDKFYTDVEHFHDGYSSKMFWLETGITANKFADQLLVGLMYSDNYKEIQQPANQGKLTL